MIDENIIHIGYGDSASGCINASMADHELLGKKVVVARDDFTQGPIALDSSHDGLRIDFWTNISKILNHDFDVEPHYQESVKALKALQNEKVHLWIGNSCHDHLMTGYLLYSLQENSIEWHAIDFSKIETETYSRDTVNLAMFSPAEISILAKESTKMTSKEKDEFIGKWEKACLESSPFRIMKDNHIHSVPDDFHDEFVLEHIPDSFAQAAKTIGEIMGKSKYKLSDVTVEYRIRALIDKGAVEYKGELKENRDFEIRKVK